MKNQKKTILLVDEDTLNLAFYKNILKTSYDMVIARSGEEALRLLEEKSFDLVLTNLMLPRVDGFELTNTIKEQYPGIPVILLSATFGYPSERKRYERYVDACLAIPVNRESLLNRVENLLREF
jgi:CheY-like chemotaxis protein